MTNDLVSDDKSAVCALFVAIILTHVSVRERHLNQRGTGLKRRALAHLELAAVATS